MHGCSPSRRDWKAGSPGNYVRRRHMDAPRPLAGNANERPCVETFFAGGAAQSRIGLTKRLLIPLVVGSMPHPADALQRSLSG